MKKKSYSRIIGPLELVFFKTSEINAAPVKGSARPVNAHIYNLFHEKGWYITLSYTMFSDDKDVRCLAYTEDTPVILHRLTHGLRMVINFSADIQKEWVQLSQARIKDAAIPHWSNLVCATDAQLCAGAGMDVRAALSSCGAVYGTRERILSNDNNKRNYYCAAFVENNVEAPLVAYGLTRVLPLLNGMR